MPDPEYAVFKALDPFFEVVQKGLSGFVDGEHYFDTIADDALFEFRYDFPGYPKTVRGRANLMALYSGYGNNISRSTSSTGNWPPSSSLKVSKAIF